MMSSLPFQVKYVRFPMSLSRYPWVLRIKDHIRGGGTRVKTTQSWHLIIFVTTPFSCIFLPLDCRVWVAHIFINPLKPSNNYKGRKFFLLAMVVCLALPTRIKSFIFTALTLSAIRYPPA